MGRKRMVSPGLLTSSDLQGLPLRARFAFVALWMYLDDRGRGKDSALLIRAHTWPLDPRISEKQVDKDLDAMVERTLVCRYVLSERRYLHCPSWDMHQKVSHPTPSVIPPCEQHEPEAWILWRASGDCPDSFASGSNAKEVSSVQVRKAVQGTGRLYGVIFPAQTEPPDVDPDDVPAYLEGLRTK